LPAVLDGVNLDHEFMREHVDSVLRPSSHDITFLSALLSLQSHLYKVMAVHNKSINNMKLCTGTVT
jgi:hypothetical protein